MGTSSTRTCGGRARSTRNQAMAVALLGRKRCVWEEETTHVWAEDERGAKRTKRCRKNREKLIRLKEDFPDMDETVRGEKRRRTCVGNETGKTHGRSRRRKRPRRKRKRGCERDLSTVADGYPRVGWNDADVATRPRKLRRRP